MKTGGSLTHCIPKRRTTFNASYYYLAISYETNLTNITPCPFPPYPVRDTIRENGEYFVVGIKSLSIQANKVMNETTKEHLHSQELYNPTEMKLSPQTPLPIL
jgi:hypothetical protein